MEKLELIEEYKILLGGISETRAKSKLILQRMDNGEEVPAEDVKRVEAETARYLTRLAELQMRDTLRHA